MNYEKEKLEKAKTVIMRIVKGVDPLTGELIKEDSFLNDPRIIRCFYLISEVLDNTMNGTYNNSAGRLVPFRITPEQKSKAVITEGKIGVNEFSRCINDCIDGNESKKLTGIELNKRLKKMGVLSEEITTEGKNRTITNDKSVSFGFEMEKRSFKGVEYDAVVINDKGKRYLLDNLESIMSTAV